LVRVCREHVLRVIFEWGRMRHTHWFCFPSLDCNCWMGLGDCKDTVMHFMWGFLTG
jgi:hypothetical protein